MEKRFSQNARDRQRGVKTTVDELESQLVDSVGFTTPKKVWEVIKTLYLRHPDNWTRWYFSDKTHNARVAIIIRVYLYDLPEKIALSKQP